MRMTNPARCLHRGLKLATLAILCLTGSVVSATTQLSPSASATQDPLGGVAQKGEALQEIEPNSEALAKKLVVRSLDWLTEAQDESGRWGTGGPEQPMAGEFNDVGVTSLAIECLLLSESQTHLDAARRGLAWLASVQDPELGLFGKRESFGFNSGHAVATRVWLEAHQGKLEGEVLEVAERALAYIYRSRNPYMGWRFDCPPSGDNDTFITSLMLRALATAKKMNLEVDRAAIEGGLNWLDQVTDTVTGRTGYTQRGGPPGRISGKQTEFPVEYSEYPTAMALLARTELRSSNPLDMDWLVSGGALIARTLPLWDPESGSIDGYYWMYGAEALRTVGGFGWERWRQHLFMALLSNQREDGAWPLTDAWSGDDDYVHMTCVYTRALQEAL
jgi:hypothetical protein